jgi:hypothetical protein
MSLVSLANEQVSISQALRWAGADVPDGFGNRKTWCPFGVTHPDGGRDAALRLYEDTNSAYCFACARSWSPVKMMADYWDCGFAEAAEKMCRLAGIREPTWRDQWASLHEETVPDRAALAEALKTWCRRVRGPSWDFDQFDARFAKPVGDCLSCLPLVMTDRDAYTWLDGCKVILRPILEMRG